VEPAGDAAHLPTSDKIAPMNGPSIQELWAREESTAEGEIVVVGELRYDGKVRASIRANWKRFRPR
jgi:hypothetical protein